MVVPLVDELALNAAQQIEPGRNLRELNRRVDPQRRVELDADLELAARVLGCNDDEAALPVFGRQELVVRRSDDRDRPGAGTRALVVGAVRDADDVRPEVLELLLRPRPRNLRAGSDLVRLGRRLHVRALATVERRYAQNLADLLLQLVEQADQFLRQRAELRLAHRLRRARLRDDELDQRCGVREQRHLLFVDRGPTDEDHAPDPRYERVDDRPDPVVQKLLVHEEPRERDRERAVELRVEREPRIRQLPPVERPVPLLADQLFAAGRDAEELPLLGVVDHPLLVHGHQLRAVGRYVRAVLLALAFEAHVLVVRRRQVVPPDQVRVASDLVRKVEIVERNPTRLTVRREVVDHRVDADLPRAHELTPRDLARLVLVPRDDVALVVDVFRIRRVAVPHEPEAAEHRREQRHVGLALVFHL